MDKKGEIMDTKQKIIQKLEDLINEAELLSDIQSSPDSRYDMWLMKSRKLMERIGGEKIVGDFNSAGSFSFRANASKQERVKYLHRALEGRKNFLSVIKDDQELFDDNDEKELKKIRHKVEAGVNLGLFKGKYTQERN